MATEGTKTPIEPGLIARIAAGTRYALTGKKPEWFGPGDTLAPVAQEEAKGREWDFPFAINTRYTPRQGEAIGFTELRALADSCDILRLVIETRKDQVERLKWAIAPINNNATPDKRCEELTAFFRMPDQQRPWAQWVRMLLEDLFVIDAPALYLHPTNGGKLWAVEQVDGATIKPVLDATGRRPAPPDTAYQQVLKGMPAVDYTADELLYMPRNQRVHKVYGFSPVEQVITTVNIAIRRTVHQLQYYTEGNIPEALIGVPETWNPDQIKQFQMYWDSLLEGNTAQRRHAKFVPGQLKIQMTKDAALKDNFDEWLARVVCFAFSISPQPFVAQVNRATAETAQEQSLLEGLEPIKNWVKGVVDATLVKGHGVTDLEFSWVDEKEIDPEKKAKIDQIYITAKVLHPDEVRADLGREPLTPEQKADMNPAPILPAPGASPGESGGGQSPPPDGTEKEALGKAKKAVPPIDRERPEVVRLTSEIQEIAVAFLADQGKAVAAQIIDAMDKVAKDADATQAQVDALVAQVDLAGWAVLAVELDGILEAIAKDGAAEALMQIGILDAPEVMINLVNEQAVAFAKDRAAELVGMKWVDGELVANPNPAWCITDSTREMLRGDIVAAMESGLSNDALADMVAESYAFSPQRAEMIARTETAFADFAGNMIAYRASGVVDRKKWIVGAGCCERCQRLQGIVVDLDDHFPNGGGDGPPLHPHCRCDVLPMVAITPPEKT